MESTSPRRNWVIAAVAALLLAHYLMALSAVSGKSNTFDELPHLWLGYSLWVAPNHKHVPTNGIVAQMLGAFPMMFQGLKAPDPLRAPFSTMDQHWLARVFFYEMGNSAQSMLMAARCAVGLLGVGVGALVFLWSRRLFGDGGGLISLTLFTFCPLMLANTPLATADMAAALGFLAAIYFFWRAINDLTTRSLLISSAALAFACAAKLSAILLAPIFLVMVIVRLFSTRPLKVSIGEEDRGKTFGGRALLLVVVLIFHASAAAAVLWIFYNFAYAEAGGAIAREAGGARGQILEWIAQSRLLPPAFVEGVTSTLLATDRAPAFLDGRYSMEGWWWFFPYAFSVKTPLATLLLLVAAPAAWFLWRGRGSRAGAKPPAPSLYDFTPLLSLIAIYGMASMSTRMNIGVRHILPMYPALFIFAGANIWWLRGGPRPARLGLGVAVAGLILASLATWPNYMGFFNTLAGGTSNGYRRLVDSSLDWGQDLPGLKRWLDKNAKPDERVYLAYFGTGQPEYFGIKAFPLPRHHDWGPQQIVPMQGGLYCVSATLLQSVYSPFPGPWCAPYENLYGQTIHEISAWQAVQGDKDASENYLQKVGRDHLEQVMRAYRQLSFGRLCAYLRTRPPDADAGHSILIYRLTDDEVKKALTGPAVELLATQADFKRNSGLVK